MTRRWSLLTAALTLCLPLSVLTTVAPAAGDVASPDPQGLTSCPTGARQVMLFRDDDTSEVQDAIANEQVQSFDFDYPNTGLWQQSQFDGAPQNPWTGTDSWFGCGVGVDVPVLRALLPLPHQRGRQRSADLPGRSSGGGADIVGRRHHLAGHSGPVGQRTDQVFRQDHDQGLRG